MESAVRRRGSKSNYQTTNVKAIKPILPVTVFLENE